MNYENNYFCLFGSFAYDFCLFSEAVYPLLKTVAFLGTHLLAGKLFQVRHHHFFKKNYSLVIWGLR